MIVPTDRYHVHDPHASYRSAPNQPGTLHEQLALAAAGLTRRPRPYGRMDLLRLLATLSEYRPEVLRALGLSPEDR